MGFFFQAKTSIMKFMQDMSKTIKMHQGGRQPPLEMHSGGGTLYLRWKCTQCMGGLGGAPPLNTGGILVLLN